jgi:hypothetical protein
VTTITPSRTAEEIAVTRLDTHHVDAAGVHCRG